MTIHWDPWHTVTVTGTVNYEVGPDEDPDYDLEFEVEHPVAHENGCPDKCMTQQEIDEGVADGLPTGPGVYQIRAWGEYWPATMAGDPAEYDGGIEVKKLTAVAR